MEPLITVIINVYNGEKFIQKCLDCVANQTYQNLEILIVNDGSTDNTLNLCENYEDGRIRIINQQNMGLSSSRNVAIDNANGEFLYFIDVDDLVENDVIEYLYELCKKYDAPMATCIPKEIYDYNFKTKNKKEKIQVLSSEEMLKKVLVSENRAVTIWNKLMKKELFEGLRFENRPINDVAITYKFVVSAKKIVYSNQIKYYYLKNSASITAKENEQYERAIDYYNVALERYNYVKGLYPDLIENDIGLIRIITRIAFFDNKITQKYLEEQNARKVLKEHFTYKVLTSKIKFKQRIKIVLLTKTPRLCRVLNKIYQAISHKYKM